jgi:hypothetical protein
LTVLTFSLLLFSLLKVLCILVDDTFCVMMYVI